ncbi:hypothetical protein EJ05DRAFT_131799 [Pseudovirgaria hyperparasitica]|uniref:Uncharacterized protein n=1 Tax=Pseudovirgaria hyperparasitica TaxID=470096 RepID=A0A6A6VZJ0_9PEZI|nr:uncharacterized protein EJ05DRAFT_131799 [Pseudovirgaria hyperparasitica]KAF2754737.1 hypothetical protein EJ05DRAFT_131799 [Pseudovirgaria hyperparasitica]
MASLGNGHRRRASASTHRTKYSIDFDALRGPGSDASSFADLPKVEPLDAIRSEDIDGPTDFTQNMDFWMRAPLREGSLRDSLAPTVTMPERISNTEVAEDLEEYIDSSEIEEQHTQGQEQHAQQQNQHPDDDQDDDDRQSTASSMENQERVLSYLDALPEADVPAIHVESPRPIVASNKAKSVRSLQPTVEDVDTTPHKPSHPSRSSHKPLSPQQPSPLPSQTPTLTDLQEQLLRQTSESNNIIRKLQETLAFTSDELKRSQSTNEGYIRELSTVRSEHERSLQRANSEWADQLAVLKETALKEKTDLEAAHLKEKNDMNSKIKTLEMQSAADRTYFARKSEELRISHTNELRQQKEEYDRASTSRDDRIASLQKKIEDSIAERYAIEESRRSALTEERERQADDLNSKLEAYQAEIARLRRELERNSAAADINLDNVKASLYQELEQEKSGSKAKISALEEQLQLAQTQFNQNDATKEVSFLSSTEIEKEPVAQARIAELEARLKTTIGQLEDMRKQVLLKEQDVSQQKQQRLHAHELYNLSQTKVADMESGLTSLRLQLDQMRNEIRIARDEANESRDARREEQAVLEKIRSKLFHHTADWEEERAKLLEKQRELQNEINELNAETAEKHIKHKTAMDSLRTKAENGIKQLGEMLEIERTDKNRARQELAAANEELAQLKIEPTDTRVQPVYRIHDQTEHQDGSEALIAIRTALQAQQEATAAARADAATARAELVAFKEDNEAVNSAFDERIQAFMREREQKWRERLQAALKDRHSMTKALMHEWGRDECGLGNPQLYQYKYLKR